MKISAYVPFFNNRNTILPALRSLRDQTIPPVEIFAIDDGSTDGGASLVEADGFRSLLQPCNTGRGAARHRAMLEASGELVVSCDATNVLPLDFIERLLPWFEDPSVAAVYGWIQDPHPKGAVGRWRAKHLFKAGLSMSIRHHCSLITGGTILRRSLILEAGNFNTALRHTEDGELGERLLPLGYDIIFDPRVPVFCNVQNTLHEVLERYWRWYAGTSVPVSLASYRKNLVYSIRGMASADLASGDWPVAIISLICPHYQFWKSFLTYR